MEIIKTPIAGVLIIQPRVLTDDRGYFFESYNQRNFQQAHLDYVFVQDNESKSSYGVVRGLHYQLPPFAQTKLVRVTLGEVLDVVVDIRKDSPTLGKHFSINLSESNKTQLLIPAGFAHGYSVLSKKAIFNYKCDQFYSKEHEAGIMFNDPMLAIDWGIPPAEMILSEKDKNYPAFGAHRT